MFTALQAVLSNWTHAQGQILKCELLPYDLESSGTPLAYAFGPVLLLESQYSGLETSDVTRCYMGTPSKATHPDPRHLARPTNCTATGSFCSVKVHNR